MIIFSQSDGMLSIAKNPVLGIVFHPIQFQIIPFQQLIMFFWEMSTSDSSSLAFNFPMDSFFEPVGHESALGGGGIFVIGIHLGGVIGKHGGISYKYWIIWNKLKEIKGGC